jgi:hypothetical protein
MHFEAIVCIVPLALFGLIMVAAFADERERNRENMRSVCGKSKGVGV